MFQTESPQVLNGQPLLAGTYTIVTNEATFSGSGQTVFPNFSGSAASVMVTGGTVLFGAGTGTSVLAEAARSDERRHVERVTGTINVSANGGGTDAVTLSGNATNILQVVPSPPSLSTDQNTAVTFQTGVKTSLGA